MKNPKQFTVLTLALILVTSFSLSPGIESAQAKPKQNQESSVEKQSKHNQKVERSGQRDSPQEDEDEREEEEENKTERKETPEWAPAWGYYCKQGENIEHPGKRKCSPTQNRKDEENAQEDTDQPEKQVKPQKQACSSHKSDAIPVELNLELKRLKDALAEADPLVPTVSSVRR